MVLGVPQIATILILSMPVKAKQPTVSRPVRLMEPVDVAPFVMLPEIGPKAADWIVHVPDQGAVKPDCDALKAIVAAVIPESEQVPHGVKILGVIQFV